MNSLRLAIVGLFALSLASLEAGPTLKISNKKGQTLEAELIAVTEKSATLKRRGKASFEVQYSDLSEESVALLKKEGKLLPIKYPKFEVDVVVSKRRKLMDGSDYMKMMEVGAKIIVENESMKRPFPKTQARFVLVGQDQRYVDKYSALAVQDFEFSIEPGEESENVMKSFMTKYDSDSTGKYNIGGYKYCGYMLLFHKDGKVTYHKTLDRTILRAIDRDPEVLKTFLEIGEKDEFPTGMLQ